MVTYLDLLCLCYHVFEVFRHRRPPVGQLLTLDLEQLPLGLGVVPQLVQVGEDLHLVLHRSHFLLQRCHLRLDLLLQGFNLGG